MCNFYAAIPATLAVGAHLNAKQNGSQKITESQGQPARRKKLPVGSLTIVAVTGLAVSSVIYHFGKKLKPDIQDWIYWFAGLILLVIAVAIEVH